MMIWRSMRIGRRVVHWDFKEVDWRYCFVNRKLLMNNESMRLIVVEIVIVSMGNYEFCLVRENRLTWIPECPRLPDVVDCSEQLRLLRSANYGFPVYPGFVSAYRAVVASKTRAPLYLEPATTVLYRSPILTVVLVPKDKETTSFLYRLARIEGNHLNNR